MTAGLPIQIDPLDLAKQQIHLQGAYPVNEMPRLAGIALPGSGKASIDLDFRLDSDKRVAILSGSIIADLNIRCERCLQPFRLTLELSPNIYLRDTRGQEIAVTEDEERDLVDFNGPVVLRDLVEEEIILNLPMMPMHDREQCSASRYMENTDLSEKKADNPFAQLANLKKK